jgi:diguanylate cyclase (GGDEF)-like protein
MDDRVADLTRRLELAHAGDLEAACHALCAALRALGHPRAKVMVGHEWPDDAACLCEGQQAAQPPTDEERSQAAELMRGAPVPGMRLLCQDEDSLIAVLAGLDTSAPADPERLEPLLHTAGARVCALLRQRRLESAVARMEQAETLQHALFAIADLAGSDLDMPDMLRELHRIVSGLMYAENFYIALYDRARDSLRFVYYVDSVDTEAPATDHDFPMRDFEHRLTWYLLRDARPLMGSTEQLREQVSGPLRVGGADSIDWLGVPMVREGEAYGALVVQSYVEGIGFTSADMALLAFVAEHVLTALERKRSKEALEQHVVARTRELADANRALSHQVAERERGEKLQATLYQIAALASADESTERFFRHVHAIVGQLLYAENFYIALLAGDGTVLEFPYSVDRHAPRREARPMGRGLTEYVIRSGTPLIADRKRARALVERGEVSEGLLTSPTCSWLGAPLPGSDGVNGVVAVQSYRDDIVYDERDAELLTFVAYQIASSLQRHDSAEALRQLNAQLEHRVDERTRELREQIAVREQVEARLKHQVMHDPLTGLPNRVYLRDRLERALSRMRRNPDRRFALIYLDIDRFKIFNDSLGHLAGDQVLCEVARRMLQSIRDPDVAARLSGDEFAILLEDAPVPQTACKVAQRLQAALQEPMRIGNAEVQASASMGIAIAGPDYASIDALLHDADVALYRAKSAGRQRFVLFDDSQQANAMDVLDQERQLRAALANAEFVPFFQPVVRLADAAVTGYEALIRWQHPQRGLLSPGEFLPVAEESGLIEAIDWQMYRAACTEGAALVRNGGFVTLNISPRHFQDDSFDARLLALAAETGFEPARMRIEVTEGTLLGDPEAVARILTRLRDAQVEAALDDFGTGYSSLGYVHRFPLKMIKIDRSFVAPLGTEGAQRSSAIIGAIIALARSLGLDLVAEGVETEAQRQALLDMGCVYGQGFLFGRPHPAAHWLGTGTAQS